MDKRPKMTHQELELLKTPKGGYTRATLEKLGVSWPPKKGWRKKLLTKTKDAEKQKRADLLYAAHVVALDEMDRHFATI